MQQADDTGKDVNDVFEDILFAEEKVIEEGYSEGFNIGSSQGNVEGFHLGYHRGAELGAELGYYSGIISKYLDSTSTTTKDSEKIQTSLEQLKQLLKSFPTTNVDNVDILKLADDIRLKFRKFCALAKISAAFPETDKLSF